MPYYPPSGSLSIGTPVVGGTPSRVLVTDAVGALDDDAGLTFDQAAQILAVANRITCAELRTGDGAAATPSITFTGDPDTGIFRVGANTIGLSTGGTQRAQLNGTGDLEMAAGGTFRWPDGAAATPSCRNATEATGMFRRAAGELNFSRAGAEVMRVNVNGWQIRQGKWSNGVAASEVVTVGAAGGAAAQPATPLGYLQILLSTGATVNVPYHNP